MKTDILIIGGGVIGLSIARELHRKGQRRIGIIERGRVGSEASYAAAGMLAPNIETDATDDFHRFGLESLNSYPGLAAQLLEETGVDIELDRTGTVCLAFDDDQADDLRLKAERQIKRRVDVQELDAREIRELEPALSREVRSALLYPRDWQVENRKLLLALQEYGRKNGIAIIENTAVSGIGPAKESVRVYSAGAEVFEAGTVILATGAWTSLIKIAETRLPVDVKPIRGQMISYRGNTKLVEHVVYSSRGYLVPRADGRLLVGATVEDVGFDSSVTEFGIAELRAAAVEIVPAVEEFRIADKWSGLRPFVRDGLPVLGPVPGIDNVVVATAHYRNGILLAPRTAEVIADHIVDNGHSEFLDLYGAGRFLEAAKATINC